MNNSEMLNIPPHWKTAKLGEACEIILGQSPPSNTYNTIGSGLPFFQGKKEFTNLNPKTEKWCSKPIRVALPNDILLSVRAPVGNTNIADLKCCIGRGLAAIRYKPNYKFAFYYLRSTINQLNELSTGSTFSAISGSDLRNFKFPLPPIPEQHLIVAKIEELFSELDNAIENLKKAKEQLKVYRQAVLKWAFEGKLTEEWRKKRESQNTKYQSEKEEVRLAAEEIQNYISRSELPKTWHWSTIGLISHKVEYGSSKKSEEFGLVPVLRMGNIQNGIFDWSDLVFSSDEAEIEKYLLKKHDVLFNRTNSPELVGKTAIYMGERKAIFAGYLIRIHYKENINPKYLNFFLNSAFAKNYGNSVKTDGVNQSNINGKKLSNYPFPFCILEEQNQIVQEIETRFSVADKLEQSIDQSLQQAEALRQSILNKAFEGRLASTNALPSSEGSGVGH